MPLSLIRDNSGSASVGDLDVLGSGAVDRVQF